MRRTLALTFPLFVVAAFLATQAAAASDGNVLRTQILKAYPSLLYVDRYRQSFPEEVQGAKPFWSADRAAPDVSRPDQLVAALSELEDQHVALIGPHAGKSETLGVLFRTASDGTMIVWRIFDPAVKGVAEGDQVLAIDKTPTQSWLRRAASMTFGGNRRGRMAEAATELGLGTPIVHHIAGLGKAVALLVQSGTAKPRAVTLSYLPVDDARATAMTRAINRPDLPEIVEAKSYRIGTLRIGAFAPQYDPVFIASSERAAKKAGTTDDQAMLIGYCAVTAAFIKNFDSVARRSDVVVIDLRGNLGGFDREVRLEAEAIAPKAPPRTWDLFATDRRGTVRLAEEKLDPSCGHVTLRRPLIVLDDAATRSAGEFMTAWLWTSGAAVVGEQTVGAGGGFEFNAQGFALPDSGLRVRTSGNFTIFDPTGTLKAGAWSEDLIVAKLIANHFGPSRNAPFAIQSVGFRPDLAASTTLEDLRGGGVAEITRAIASLRSRHLPN